MTEGADPASIGPFVVLRKLGEGGMGIVYAGYDVALDRKVALKLIRRQLLDRSEVRARMVREAQAMARLSHPNVVQVYQVGEHGDEIYVAMEYVEGQTLTAWLQAEKRSWQTVLRTVSAAGRGLAAAHAAGLVHRDFKPDNVLVSKEGRPCVLDFGLVHAEGTPAASLGNIDLRTSATGLPMISAPGLPMVSRLTTLPTNVSTVDAGDSIRLTQAGKALGTPAYMSPEQHFGDEAVGPASDQFSFAATLYESLYGARPFGGSTWDEIKRAVRRGVVPPPPRDSAVPGRIFRILVRALAPAPDMRWASLEAMLDALERDPRKTVLRAAGVLAIAGVAAAGSYAAAVSQREASLQCTGAAQELAGVWDETRAAAGERAFVATGSPIAGDTWKRVHGRLDTYANAWIVGRTQACEAHADGTQSTTLFDRRTACLSRRRTYLSALIDVYLAADRSVVENAVQAAAALPSVDSCADADALLAAVPPPEDPQTAAQVDTRRAQLARAAALEGTGQYDQGIQLAREVRSAADTLRYAPLAAEAAMVEGSVSMMLWNADDADKALTYALRTAIVHGIDALVAEATIKRIFVVGYMQRHPAVALDVVPAAEALVERARDDGRLAALLHNNAGTVYELDGAGDRAREEYERTIELLSRRPGAVDPLLPFSHHNLAGLHWRARRLELSREHYSQSGKLFSELFGEQHPMVAHSLSGIADIDLAQGHHARARDGYSRALALMEASYGLEHLYLVIPLDGLGDLSRAEGELEAAADYFRRAIAIGEKIGSTNENVTHAVVGLAETLAARDPPEARNLLTRAVGMYEADGGPKNPDILPVALRAGQLAATAGDLPAARTWFDRVLSDPPGPKEQALTRGLAALELARVLPPAEQARACTLAGEAKAALPADHPRQPELQALLAGPCRRAETP